jgi:hypothetical protein
MARKNVADLLVDVLAETGVPRIYGVSGDSLNGVTDSIRASKRIQWIHVRHEETAAFAAGAEVHLTGRLAVCAGSCGPGNLHLINGLYDQQAFPWVDQIHEVKDPAKVGSLDSAMVERLKSDEHVRLWLSIPEIIDRENESGETASAR